MKENSAQESAGAAVSRRSALKLGGTVLAGAVVPTWRTGNAQSPAAREGAGGVFPIEAIVAQSVSGEYCAGRSLNGHVINIGEFVYQKGIGTDAPFEATYNIPANVQRFDAWVGFDITSEKGAATFQVFVDGWLKFSSGRLCYAPYSRAPECNPHRPMRVSVPVQGASTLTLKTLVHDGSAGLMVNWGDAQFSPAGWPEYFSRKKVAGIAAAPPMGWNPYNWNGNGKNFDTFKEIVDALSAKGFREAGYQYVNLDGGWAEEPAHDANGYPQPSKSMFPEGLQPLSNYIHGHGFKFGVYSSMEMVGRDKHLKGMWDGGNEAQWVESFEKWGVDYLKYDFSTRDGNFFMLRAIRNSRRPIFYNSCAWGHQADFNWAYFMGANSMRSTYDVNNIWQHGNDINPVGILDAVDQGEAISQFTGSGFWNDLDMLVVGLQTGTFGEQPEGYTLANQIEQRTQFSMYSMLAASLIVGCDVRNIDDYSLETLLNREVIAIDQDPLGVAAWRVVKLDDIEIWKRPLDNGDWAVALLNRGEHPADIKAVWENLHLSGKFNIRDLWQHENLGSFCSQITLNVASHETKVLRFSPVA